ncbi:hypothetical protein RXY33_27120, partial [Klebsiella pneumoniae]|nr:hypothetical protein [Klebsiella pneumoniae]
PCRPVARLCITLPSDRRVQKNLTTTHISQLTLSASAYGTAHIGAAIADGEVITVYPPGYEPDDSIYFDSTANYDETYYYTGNKYGKSE